ncbi:MAG: tail fiber protein [Burkholderiales bacterium]|nr:tail fiber protein [Burkholderiales bacterium]
MDRAYGARVVQVEPKFAEDAPLGYPTDGSSTGGQLATVPKAPWYNAVTEEIRNAIVGGGIKPDKNTLDQLNQSIEARLTKLEESFEKALKKVSDQVAKFETFPPGFIIYTGCFINSPNWILCDGRAVSRSGYANLFRAIGTIWGGGNGTTTFNVPYLLDRALWGSNWGIGQYIPSGAPPIWAEMGCDDRAGGLAKGAVVRVFQNNVNTSANGGDGAPWSSFHFDASRCALDYGRSDHIQPPASRVPVYIHI